MLSDSLKCYILPSPIDPIMLIKNSMIPKPLELAKKLLCNVVQAGETVVDATLGNGHDALFLAQLVGAEGKLVGFDIQQAAVDASEARMNAEGVSWYEFHCCGHELMADKAGSGFAAVMFNLGYLPNADKALITQTETTLQALEGAMIGLRMGGVITLMCYPGHEGGERESAAVVNYVSSLQRKNWKVFRYAMMNGVNTPPFLIVIEKVG